MMNNVRRFEHASLTPSTTDGSAPHRPTRCHSGVIEGCCTGSSLHSEITPGLRCSSNKTSQMLFACDRSDSNSPDGPPNDIMVVIVVLIGGVIVISLILVADRVAAN